MFDLLGNLVEVDTTNLTLTPHPAIPPGWTDNMTEADWVDYARAWMAEPDGDDSEDSET